MFHHNKSTEIGLVAQTRKLLGISSAPEQQERDKEKYRRYTIGPTEFLKKHTSTQDWLEFSEIFKLSIDMELALDERSLHCTLSDAVRKGWFETRHCGRAQYRRVPGEFITEPKPAGKRGVGFISFKRKTTSLNSW